jgi:hypothetical protein
MAKTKPDRKVKAAMNALVGSFSLPFTTSHSDMKALGSIHEHDETDDESTARLRNRRNSRALAVSFRLPAITTRKTLIELGLMREFDTTANDEKAAELRDRKKRRTMLPSDAFEETMIQLRLFM